MFPWHWLTQWHLTTGCQEPSNKRWSSRQAWPKNFICLITVSYWNSTVVLSYCKSLNNTFCSGNTLNEVMKRREGNTSNMQFNYVNSKPTFMCKIKKIVITRLFDCTCCTLIKTAQVKTCKKQRVLSWDLCEQYEPWIKVNLYSLNVLWRYHLWRNKVKFIGSLCSLSADLTKVICLLGCENAQRGNYLHVTKPNRTEPHSHNVLFSMWKTWTKEF